MQRLNPSISNDSVTDIFVIRSIFRRYIVDIKTFLNQFLQGRKESRLIGINLLNKLEAAMLLLDTPEEDVALSRKNQALARNLTEVQQDAQLRLDQINAIRDVLETFENAVAQRTGLVLEKPVSSELAYDEKESHRADSPEHARERTVAHDVETLKKERAEIKNVAPSANFARTNSVIKELQAVSREDKTFQQQQAAFLQQLRFLGGKRQSDTINILPKDAKSLGEEKIAAPDEEKKAQERETAQTRILKTHTALTLFLKRKTIKEILLQFNSAAESTVVKGGQTSDAQAVTARLDNLIAKLNLENLPPVQSSMRMNR